MCGVCVFVWLSLWYELSATRRKEMEARERERIAAALKAKAEKRYLF